MHKFSTDELVNQRPTPDKLKTKKRNPIVFILHNIRSLENVGLFFRLADAFLVDKIYLTGYTGYPPLTAEDLTKKGMLADPRSPRIVNHAEREINKTAIKLVSLVPWEQNEDVSKVIGTLKLLEYQIVGLEQTNESVDYRKATYKFPLALIFGHERTGVEDDLLDLCDQVIEIPMLGNGNSHNVAISCAIVTSHLINSAGLSS